MVTGGSYHGYIIHSWSIISNNVAIIAAHNHGR